MLVSVFGGSRPPDNDYLTAYRLGKLLGEKGYSVLTGGYIGTMEAVSRGVAEHGGHVIGVTCGEIEKWRSIEPNQWVKEEKRFPMLYERMYALISECDSAIVLPGGPGTLAETAVMWTHLLIGAIQPKPLILVGWQWKHLFDEFFHDFTEYIPKNQKSWLIFADSIEKAVNQLG